MIITTLNDPLVNNPDELRTDPTFSVMGGIAASLGVNLDQMEALYGPDINQKHGFLSTKLATPAPKLNPIQQVINAMTMDAKNYRFNDIPDGKPDYPGSWIVARAMIHASVENYDLARDIYEDLKDVMPDGWYTDKVARTDIMAPYQELLEHSQRRFDIPECMSREDYRVTLVDHATIEGALARIIGMTPQDLIDGGVLDKKRARNLLKGKDWWNQVEIDDMLIPFFVETSWKLKDAMFILDEPEDSNLEAMATLSPMLTGLAWQLWPRYRTPLEEVSPWISVYRGPAV